jgi:vacuolar-type H+-ATPase subunit I/STV1
VDPTQPVKRKIGGERTKHQRKYKNEYDQKRFDGFNLLKKWVPGTEKLNRGDVLMVTVNYIKELLNKEKDLEEKIKEVEKKCKELEEKIKELETSQRAMDTDSAHPLMPMDTDSPFIPQEMAVSTDTGASEVDPAMLTQKKVSTGIRKHKKETPEIRRKKV